MNSNAKATKMAPKPSASPDLITIQGDAASQANTKVSPFGAASLAASHSIQNTNQVIAKTIDLGVQQHPVNARNLNVQSVMAESSNQIEAGQPAMQVNLRKTFNM